MMPSAVDETVLAFVHTVTGSVFKILPMMERELDEGNDFHVMEYIDSLLIEMNGASAAFPVLKRNPDYLRAVLTLQGLVKSEQVSLRQWRREVLKMCSLLNEVEQQLSTAERR